MRWAAGSRDRRPFLEEFRVRDDVEGEFGAALYKLLADRRLTRSMVPTGTVDLLTTTL